MNEGLTDCACRTIDRITYRLFAGKPEKKLVKT
jgi:hypothetical protein